MLKSNPTGINSSIVLDLLIILFDTLFLPFSLPPSLSLSYFSFFFLSYFLSSLSFLFRVCCLLAAVSPFVIKVTISNKEIDTNKASHSHLNDDVLIIS